MNIEMPKIGLAAGMVKSFQQLPLELIDLASHVTFGSFTLEPREGNKEPTYWFNEQTQSSMNAVGLSNKGLQFFLDEDLPSLVQVFEDSFTHLRVSLAPLKRGDLRAMCRILNQCKYAEKIDEVEINAACPNHRTGAELHPVLAHDPEALEGLMEEVSTLSIRKAIKIAPNMEQSASIWVTALCEKYDFKTVVSGNTLPSIAPPKRLSVKNCGQGGAVLRGIGLWQAGRFAPECQNRNLKLIACGAVMSLQDHEAYVVEGADETQIATAYMEYGSKIFRDIHMEV